MKKRIKKHERYLLENALREKDLIIDMLDKDTEELKQKLKEKEKVSGEQVTDELIEKILKVLVAEPDLHQLPWERLNAMARRITEGIVNGKIEPEQESSISKKLRVEQMQMDAALAQSEGRIHDAFELEMAATDLQLSI
jgi:hypothetical protein